MNNNYSLQEVKETTDVEVIYLREDYGWVYDDNTPANIGTWDSDTRIAKLNEGQAPIDNPIFIEVNDAEIDGSNVTLTYNGNYSLLNLKNNFKILIKNFNFKENTRKGILAEYSMNIIIKNNTFTNNYINIYLLSCNDCIIEDNYMYLDTITKYPESVLKAIAGIVTWTSFNTLIKNNKILVKNILNEGPFNQLQFIGILDADSSNSIILDNDISVLSNSLLLSVYSTSLSIEGISSYKNSIIEGNKISISKNIFSTTEEASNSESVKISGISSSSYGNIKIKENSIYIESNTLNGRASNSLEYLEFDNRFIGIYFIDNSSSVEVSDNLILISKNNDNIIGNINSIFSGVFLDVYNTGNIISNNEIYITENKKSTASDSQFNSFSAIFLYKYNNHITIHCNTLTVKNNLINALNNELFSFNGITSIINYSNTISENNIILTNNYRYSMYGYKYIADASLILFNDSNYNNIIKNNILTRSQFNGITLRNFATNNLIINNSIIYNSNYGIALYSTTASEDLSTDNKIFYNCIESNGNYGLYISSINNTFINSYVKQNNFIASINRNAYVADTPNNFYENYWSDWDGCGFYTILPGNNEDKSPLAKPLKLCCNSKNENHCKC